MKKRGFGAGRWNGAGGKVEAGETIEQAMIREAEEEISVTPATYQKVAEIEFDEIHAAKERETLQVHVFTASEWVGEPTESEEMAPQWFSIDDIPYHEMWDDDQYWLPNIIAGHKLKCKFTLDNQDKVVHQKVIKI